ncbi:MAG: choice-of-anchor D domain-containing protein, partial [Bacteroidota bacterium]
MNRNLLYSTRTILTLALVLFTLLSYSQSPKTYSSSGTFTVPAGVTTVTAQAWGGGGKGGTRTSNGQAGGGGGGAYALQAVTVNASNPPYTVTVGSGSTTTAAGGDSWFSTSGTVLAKGGLSVPNNDINGLSGGLATSSIGSTTLKGGNGANGSATVLVGGGGGGGSSAGSALAGTNGNGTAGGGAPAGGGNGGNGKLITSQGDGSAGIVPGGGGGGAYKSGGGSNYNGGNGANGQVILSWTCPTYSLTNTSIVSPLCTPNSASVTLTGSAAGLPIGTYTVSYTLSGSNTGSNTATMTVSTAGTGNFSTIALNNAGITTVTINNLSSGVAPDNCSTNITSSNSANVTVNATPAITSTTPGSRTGIGTVVLGATASVGTISWYANATGGTALGMGTSFTTPGLITTTTFYVEVVNGTCILSPRTAVVATVNFSEISVSGNGLNIADEDTTPIVTDYTNLGTANLGFNISRTYTIQNSGTIDLTIGTITISGVNASEFVVTTPPSATVIPGGSTTFTIRFTPLLAGSRNANVSFVTNDADENPFNFDIAGTGGTGVIPEINVQGLGVTIIDGDSGPTGTDGTDFGSLIIPSAVTRTFTIQNTGTGPLVLSGTPIVLLSGSTNFIVSTQPSSNTIAAGSSLSFQIKFEPTETGSSVALVSINNDDSDESIYDFAITGSAVVTGKEIDIQGNEISIVDGDVTPSVLDQTDFGITDSSTPIPLTYNIYSFGSNTLTLNTTISITGTNASLFSVTPIPSTLNAGAVTSFVITFTPTSSLGVKTATVTITSDDPNEGTYNFDLKAEVQTLPPLTIAPGGITSNLKFWLKADSNIGTIADNTAISSWPDQTHGNTKNAISKFAKEPKFQNNPSYNVNFNPVIHFNGNNWMSGGQGFNNSDMFIVVKPTSQVSYTSSAQDIYSGDDTGTNKGSQDVTGFQMGNTSSRHSNDVLAYNQGANTSFGIAENSTTKNYTSVNIFNPRKNATYPTVKMDILNNGNTLSTSSVFTGTYKDIVNTRYWLGRSEFFDASYDGDILEVINYNIRNSDADKSKIETYLAIKYGITLGVNGVSQNYINSAGTTIYAAGSGFNYNIAGIGRDDKSLLNQKQSKTENTNSDITIGLGDIFDKNSSNTNTFNDKDFLVWGNNNNTLTAQSPIVVDMSTGTIPALSTEVDFISIGRTWKVIETGINVPSVKVSIPSVMLTATITPPGDFLMFISDSPVFNPTAEYRIMNTNGSNLEANYDFNGTKYITFGYAPERTFIRAIDFDGVNDYLDAGKVLDLNTNFTVSAWVKRSSNNQTILSKRNNPFSIGYDLSINSSQKAEMSWFNGTKQTITSSVILPLEKWHHIGVIFDGTTAKLYIDGVLDVSKAMATVPANTQSFLIAAADGESPTSFFNGTIDEVRVWNVALTDKELRYVMNQEISRNSTFTSGAIVPNNITLNEIGSIPWANLSAYYPMSTYTFTNAKDISSNNHTAAIKNLTTVDWQTAPLPYESLADGDWQTTTTWKNNAVQDIPYSLSIIDNITRIDWNIVQTNHTITSTGNKTILGLFVNSNTLSATNDSKIEISHYLKLDGKIDLVGRSQLVQKLGSDLDPTSS